MDNRILRQVLKDTASLRDYIEGGTPPSFDDVRLRALVAERLVDQRYPDHVHRNLREERLKSIKTLWEALDLTLSHFADHLHLHDGKLCVRFKAFSAWQCELARLAPLPFVARAMLREVGAPATGQMADYARTHLAQFKHSVLIAPICPHVDDLIRTEGLYETHLHLNGTTEVDKVWVDALARPLRFATQLEATMPKAGGWSWEEEARQELYQQIELRLTPKMVIDRLRLAERLRRAICRRLAATGSAPRIDLGRLADQFAPEDEQIDHPQSLHPLEHAFCLNLSMGQLVPELLMHILIYDRLTRGVDEELTRALHLYLLILNATFVSLLVQQAEQCGFDQFQKYTFTQMRWVSEQEYSDRFHQLCGQGTGDLAFIEGRIAPPDNPAAAYELVERVLKGYVCYLREARRASHLPEGMDVMRMDDLDPERLKLRLIAHFIKRQERPRKGAMVGCRFQKLRRDVARRWRSLRQLRTNCAVAHRYVVGIDAASNELHTPPEVFAPLYRAARRAGMIHFTYHVGEDFEHLLSGIRAIWEAAHFLDLQCGNRLGHATAVGIDPALWIARMPKTLYLRKGDWLDSLIFFHHLSLSLPAAAPMLGRLIDDIHRLSVELYGYPLDPHQLWAAMQLRHLDPLLIKAAEKDFPTNLPEDEVAEWELLCAARRKSPDTYTLWVRYNDPTVHERCLEMVEIATDYISAASLRQLQDIVLGLLAERRLVIETLPTSNVRISIYQDHSEHHLWRWLNLDGSGREVCVTVGSDDPGIFSCNLRGEFIHIFREVAARTSPSVAWEKIRKLNDTSRLHRFLIN